MRQNPVGEPAATAALNLETPRRRSSLKRFGPFAIGARGFTPVFRGKGQKLLLVLGFLPHSTHESRVLLATPNRSGLRPSFPARPIRLLRLSALECLTSLTDSMAYYALC